MANMKTRHGSSRSTPIVNESGQATVEVALVVTLLITLVCASVDFGRALNTAQVMIELTRQGSILASRGSTLAQAASGVIAGESSLDFARNGEVIITAVTNSKSGNTITGQTSQGGISRSSRIGTGVGNPATMPAAASGTLQPGQTIYVTEVFYTFQPITPIGNLTGIVMPSTLYESAYF
jgi:Flp pilus assembly protein TadG